MLQSQCTVCSTPLASATTVCPRCAAAPTLLPETWTRAPYPPADTRTASVEERLPRRFGRFLLLRRIGHGGMGVVYEAEDEKLVRRVALKTLITAGPHESLRERFLREARIAGTLDHPNVVSIYDSGEVDGTLYFTMTLVAGLPLEDVIPHLHGAAPAPPPDWLRIPDDRTERVALVLRWFEGALAGLQHAHDRGIVHRDLKPANLLLDAGNGLLRLADFGLARAGHLAGMTQDGVMMGTFAYMSPEQIRGGEIGRASDVYSMGVSLYRTLLDRLPFSADSTADYLGKILEARPAAAGPGHQGIPRDLLTILLKTMEKSPVNRYASAAELGDDLTRFRRYEPIRARSVGAGGRIVRWTKRKPALASALGVLAAAAVVLGVLSIEVARSSRILRRQEAARRFVEAIYADSAGDFEEALAGFGRVIELEPRHLEARIGRAATLLRLKDPERYPLALVDLGAAERIEPALVAVHRLMGRLLDRTGAAEEAARADTLAKSLEARLPIDFQLLGDLARYDGNCQEAVRLYGEAIRREPQLPVAAFYRGQCLRQLGQNERARVDYEVLSRLWPDHAVSHNNLANVLDDLKLHDDALAARERALEVDPNHPMIVQNYGWALARAGRLPEAEARLRRALELDPELSRARVNLGLVLQRSGRANEAAAAFRETIRREESRPAAEASPFLAKAWVNLCDVLLRKRDLQEADGACRRAVELFPQERDNHYNMATLRMLQGNREEALESLSRNVELGDHDHGYLLSDPVFKPLHRDSRFRALLRRM